ncbi:MAG: ATP-dependent RNA helicase dbp6 [Trichoglossum hirsutum]|nr:MAG: ATP-dependent RNA helicase dbp6 [Trichoglossum hirsutum]
MASQFYARYVPPIPSPSQAITKENDSSKLKRKSRDLESPQAALLGETLSTSLKKRKTGEPNEKSGPAAVDKADHTGDEDDVAVETNRNKKKQRKRRVDKEGTRDIRSTRETGDLAEQAWNSGVFSQESNDVKKRKQEKADRAPDNSPSGARGVSGSKTKAKLSEAGGKVEKSRKAKKWQNLGGSGAEDNDQPGLAGFTEPKDIGKARDGGTQAKPKNSMKKRKDKTEHKDESKSRTDNERGTSQFLAGKTPKKERILGKPIKGEKAKETSETRDGDHSDGSTEPYEDMEEESKYESILSKFQRSTQLSETLANEAPNGTNCGPQNQEGIELQGLVPLPQPEEAPDSNSKLAFSALPSWLAHPITAYSNSTISFRDLHLNAKLISSLESRGYRDSFAIQSVVLPMLLPGPTQHMGDLCISAATGSGKTLAYVLPIIESLRNRAFTRLRGLIVVPTRELVMQAKEVCEFCSVGSNLSIGMAVGTRAIKAERELLIKKGQKYDPQAYKEMQKRSTDAGGDSDYNCYSESDSDEDFVTLPEHVACYSSKVDILICTPGRLVDHIRTTTGFTLEDLQWLVVDEADRLLNQSFQEWIDVVLRAIENTKEYDQMKVHEQIILDMGLRPPKNNTRKIVLSATMTRDIGKLSALKLRNPKLIVVDGHGSARSKLSAKEGREGEAEGQGEAEPVDVFGLPPTLKEWAIAAGDGSEKPLYLLQLLQTKILTEDGDNGIASITPKDVSPTDNQRGLTSSEDSTSDDESESDVSDASSSPAGTPIHDSSSSSDSSTSGSASPLAKVKTSHSISYDKANTTGGILIFTKSKESANRLSRLLSLLHPPLASRIGAITGSTPSSTRRKILAAFRTNKLSILLASDLVARGLDVENAAHIVNYDLPKGIKGYIHRVGRTARAGRKGEAWTLITEKEARWFWREIGGGVSVGRSGDQKVARVRLDIDALGLEYRKRYKEALDTLKSEVRGTVPTKSVHGPEL